MRTHTPGPWVFEPWNEPDDDAQFIVAEDREAGHVLAAIPGPIARGTPEGNARLIAAAPDGYEVLTSPTWLVWSNHHRTWWAPHRGGYTLDINAAGRYSLEEALRCCDLRSRRPDGAPNELVVPAPEWITGREAFIAKLEGRQ